jgi:hypothetical protein
MNGYDTPKRLFLQEKFGGTFLAASAFTASYRFSLN